MILEEQDRWRDLKGSGYIAVNGADGTSPPTIVDFRDDGSGYRRVWLPTGIGAGTFGSPASKTDAILAVRSGNGWTTSGGAAIPVLYNCDTQAVGSGKAGWAIQREDGSWELVVADC